MIEYSRYPTAIEIDAAGDHVVAMRDFPEIQTAGDDRPQALELAADALAVVVRGRIRDGAELPPASSPLAGEVWTALPLPMAAKAAVYALWRAAGISKSELARRMGRSESEARRVLDPDHGTKLDQVEEAARALGASLSLATHKVEAAA